MWFRKESQTKNYCVAGHSFQLRSKLEDWEKALNPYRPFEILTIANDILFSIEIKEFCVIPESRLLWEIKPKENGTPYFSVSSIEDGYLFTIAYLFHNPRRFYLLASKDFKKGTLIVPKEYGTKALPDYELIYGINFSVMRFFAHAAIPYRTLQVHASAVMHEGKAYLFLGPSGTGKSTHSRLWLTYIEGCDLLNDDGPIIRVEENDEIRVYGSPWSGKTPCHRNLSAPLGALVDLMQAPSNQITLLPPIEAYVSLRSSATGLKWERQIADQMDRTLVIITEKIPHYRLRNIHNKEAAELCALTVKKHIP